MPSQNKKLSQVKSELYLRRATEEDKDLLYGWANDALTRQNSFSTSQIPYSDHCRWFDAMLKNKNRIQYIVMDEDTAVGQIRLDIDENEAEISYSIAAVHRGKGYGKKALYIIQEEVRENLQFIDKLVGQVKPNNEASARAFLSEGYVETFRQFEFEIIR